MSGAAVPPGVIADAVAAVKEFARVGGGQEDALTGRLVATAIGVGEAFCGTAFVRRAFEDVLAPTGGWQRLSATPVAAITGVVGLPANGAPVVLPVDRYRIDVDADGDGWIRVTATIARVAVAYEAGSAAAWNALPAPFAQGVTALAAHLLSRPDERSVPPAAVAALWRPLRRMRLAGEARR